MRKIFSYLIIFVFSATAFSVLFAELPEMITTRKSTVGPGVIQKTLNALEKPWEIHVLEADLQNPYIHIENVDGGGLKPPSISTAERESDNYRLVAAVNGDFFQANGHSVNANISRGEIVHLEHYQSEPRVYWPAFSVNKDKKLYISYHIFNGTAAFSDTLLPVLGVNEYPGPGGLALYNSHAGAELQIDEGVSAVRLVPLNDWAVNGSVYCMMDSLILDSCMAALLPGQAYLSGTAWMGNMLRQHYQKGRLVKLELNMVPFEDLSDSSVSYHYLPKLEQLKEMIGGYPVIVRNGENYALEGFANANGTNSFATDLHPRTAVGFNRDTTKMYMVVVDGRQPHSIGIDLPDLADFLIDLGAWQALNLDGGGSSVFIVENRIMNSPSDGQERAVRNSCAVYSSAPEGELAALQIELDSLVLYKGESFRFFISGRDNNYHYREIPDSIPLIFSYDEELGSLEVREDTIIFTASEKAGEGFIRANLSDSLHSNRMYLRIRDYDPLFLEPKDMISDTLQPVRYHVKGVSENGDTLELPNRMLNFSLEDTSLGSIDKLGEFHGKKAGKTQVIVSYGDVRDSAAIRVCSTEGEVRLDRLNSLDGWIVADEAVDGIPARMELIKHETAERAMQINYHSILGGKIYLKKDIKITGTPEMLILDFDSRGIRIPVTVNFRDAKGKAHSLSALAQADFPGYQKLFFSLADLKAAFPLTIKDIIFLIPGSEIRSSFSLRSIRVAFPSAVSINSIPLKSDQEIQFAFHPQDKNYSDSQQNMVLLLPQSNKVKLEIFNINGERVDQLFERRFDAGYHSITWQSAGLPNGIYFYKLSSAEHVSVGKIIIF